MWLSLGTIAVAFASARTTISPHMAQPAIQPRMALSVTEDAAPSTMLSTMDEEALLLDPSTTVKPKRGADGRLEPVLTLPGDSLETTRLMMGLTLLSTALTIGVVLRALLLSASPLVALFAVAMGGVAGEMFSGTFHWATDNYGRLETPVVGFACAAFQGHHLAPWTISHRSVWNNVYKIGTATLPLITAAVVCLPPAGAAFCAVMLYCQVLAQEFHRWSHTPPKMLAPWQRALQSNGFALPFAEHCAHHKPPFDKKYCILTGGLNPLLDSEPLYFWRRLEAFFYRRNGVEPLSWQSEKVKALALSL